MTVIAFRDGIMASDTQVSDGDTIYRTPPGALKLLPFRGGEGVLGYAGNYGWAPIIRDLLERRSMEELVGSRLMMKVMEGVEDWGCLFAVDNRLYGASIGSPPHPLPPIYSIGSGAAFAFGAMDAGCSAIEAAKIAAKRDVRCNMPIVSLTIPWKSGQTGLRKKPKGKQ